MLATLSAAWSNSLAPFFSRSGAPGFVQVINRTELIFPDYDGNAMFNTLGNIIVNPYVGLLFLDFTYGHTLQLSGQAEVLFESESVRKVRVTIEDVIEVPYAVPLTFEFIGYAPTNPELKH